METLQHSAQLGPEKVAEALNSRPGPWPSAGDWLVVECRDDGTARYGIAPFVSVAKVTNPREACAAVRRELR